jgi:hypothetical protein
MKVYAHEVANAGIFRNNFGNINNGADYEVLLRNLYGNQKNKLQLLYPMYDSIRQKNQLNKMEFAEVIVSSIQEIPYTLILNKSCDPSLYNDEFIQDYLNNEKGDCVGNVKYGIFSPSEFLEKLKGDCDTRTLLLFTILTHFGYDVAILSSDIYKHSIIGINLPYQGLFKKINGKRYVLWETTAVGMPPGLIPSQISNVRNWYPSLLNNN